MAHALNTESKMKHPCAGKSCTECETCIFDQELFLEDTQKKENMDTCTSCHLCGNLIKNYIGDDRLQFNACCGRFMVMFSSYSRPRIIKAKTGPMVPLTPPAWCPKNRGVTQMSVSSAMLAQEMNDKALPAPSQVSSQKEEVEPIVKTYKTMTYTERREKLMALPKHLKWDDIVEGEIYVIPKILSQARKVVRVVMKSDTLLRCSEIDEYGKESQVLCSVYPRDIDVVFMTKVLKY
jgi:hypothetical protein